MAGQSKMGTRHVFPYGGKWNVVTEKDGILLLHSDFYHPDQDNPSEVTGSTADDLRQIIQDYNDNRLAYFLPHGEGRDFINDWDSDICMLTAPTRTGKSAHGVAWTCLRGIKCDPKWHCFTHHGIDYHPWRGPRKLVVSSYQWTNVQELWEEYLKWIPRHLLGRYALDWGSRKEDKGAHIPVDHTQGRGKTVTLTDKTALVFLCDRQAQGPWEGKRWDDGHFDEQRQREKFIGYLRGTSNSYPKAQCCHTLTGHVLDDRPDTGASGWIKTELFDGKYTFGRTISRYKLSIADTPDVIMSPEEKEKLHQQWVVEPAMNKDEPTLRKAEARYHGGFESGSGLVIDNFYVEHHVIPEYNREHTIVRDATKYRGVDHGLGRPCAAVWVEVFPWGDKVAYQEYYEPGRTIPYHAKQISMLSGSKIAQDGLYADEIIEGYPLFAEQFGAVRYRDTVLDGRSFESPAQERNCSVGQLYRDLGLDCRPACTDHNFKTGGGGQVELLKKALMLEPDRKHIMWHFHEKGIISHEKYKEWLDGRNGDFKNGSSLYIVCTLRWTIGEMTTWAVNAKTGKPKDENNHIVGGALKYVIAEDPSYEGKFWDDEDELDAPVHFGNQEFKHARY